MVILAVEFLELSFKICEVKAPLRNRIIWISLSAQFTQHVVNSLTGSFNGWGVAKLKRVVEIDG